MSDATRDRRLLRGAASRRTIVRHAVDVASEDGLDGLSLGRLAGDLELSKSGVQTLFGSKENLQVAVAEAAGAAFTDAVVRPALARDPGAERLGALIDGWIAYAEEPLFRGGCFWTANLPVFDSVPGPVRDVLLRQQAAWRQVLATEVRAASPAVDADLAAFQIDAVLTATNIALRAGEEGAVPRARRAVAAILPVDHRR
jgi:AcrR family transcriptional regulator